MIRQKQNELKGKVIKELERKIKKKDSRLNKYIEKQKELDEAFKKKLKARLKQEFFTPKPLVLELIELSKIENNEKGKQLKILEPSAGWGNIIKELLNISKKKNNLYEISIDMVEIVNENRKSLMELQEIVPSVLELQKEPDFIQFLSSQEYDYVFMNPPFHLQKRFNKQYNQDVYSYHFLMRAYAMLKMGGRLVAITGREWEDSELAQKFIKDTNAKTINKVVEWKGEGLKKGMEISKLKMTYWLIDKLTNKYDNDYLLLTDKLVIKDKEGEPIQPEEKDMEDILPELEDDDEPEKEPKKPLKKGWSRKMTEEQEEQLEDFEKTYKEYEKYKNDTKAPLEFMEQTINTLKFNYSILELEYSLYPKGKELSEKYENLIEDMNKTLIKIIDKNPEIKEMREVIEGMKNLSTDEPVPYTSLGYFNSYFLLYILKKHKNDCAMSDLYEIKFLKNKIIKYKGKSNKFSDATKWNFNELAEKLYKQYKKCKKEGKILVLLLTLSGKGSGHQNMLIFNYHRNEVERFEPHGSRTGSYYWNSEEIDKQIYTNIVDKMNKIIAKDGGNQPKLIYVPPKETCPKGFKGFQSYEGEAVKKEKRKDNVIIKDPSGFCMAWSMFFGDLRLKFPKKSAKVISDTVLNIVKREPEELRKFIRGQVKWIKNEIESIIGEGNFDKLVSLDIITDDKRKATEKEKEYFKMLTTAIKGVVSLLWRKYTTNDKDEIKSIDEQIKKSVDFIKDTVDIQEGREKPTKKIELRPAGRRFEPTKKSDKTKQTPDEIIDEYLNAINEMFDLFSNKKQKELFKNITSRDEGAKIAEKYRKTTVADQSRKLDNIVDKVNKQVNPKLKTMTDSSYRKIAPKLKKLKKRMTELKRLLNSTPSLIAQAVYKVLNKEEDEDEDDYDYDF